MRRAIADGHTGPASGRSPLRSLPPQVPRRTSRPSGHVSSAPSRRRSQRASIYADLNLLWRYSRLIQTPFLRRRFFFVRRLDAPQDRGTFKLGSRQLPRGLELAVNLEEAVDLPLQS